MKANSLQMYCFTFGLIKATIPLKHWEFFAKNGGKPFPEEQMNKARAGVEEYATSSNTRASLLNGQN